MLALRGVYITQGDFSISADFTLPTSGIFAIIGPSGGGKSTLLSAIAGFLPISGGTITWQGEDWVQIPAGERPIAQLFQDYNLFAHLSVERNLALGFTHKFRLNPDDKAKINTAITATGLAGKANRKPAELSGGEQSRAALARIFLQDKPIILLDEPFAALGPALRHGMLDLVARYAKEKNRLVLMVTHTPSDALRIADQVITLLDGQVQPPRDAKSLLANPDPALAQYLGEGA